MPRGRRSQASLSIVPPAIPGAGRPDPPAHLDGSEAQIWRAVVGALPDRWVDGRHGLPIASHAGPAMPQPKVAGFEGVLHLHGRLGDGWIEPALSETSLIL